MRKVDQIRAEKWHPSSESWEPLSWTRIYKGTRLVLERKQKHELGEIYKGWWWAVWCGDFHKAGSAKTLEAAQRAAERCVDTDEWLESERMQGHG